MIQYFVGFTFSRFCLLLSRLYCTRNIGTFAKMQARLRMCLRHSNFSCEYRELSRSNRESNIALSILYNSLSNGAIIYSMRFNSSRFDAQECCVTGWQSHQRVMLHSESRDIIREHSHYAFFNVTLQRFEIIARLQAGFIVDSELILAHKVAHTNFRVCMSRAPRIFQQIRTTS